MGKHLIYSKQSSTVQFQHNYPGCMWGNMLHFLGYHHWHINVKKVFPLRKHYWGKHARYGRKTILYDHGIFEDQQSEAEEAEPLVVKKENKKVSATGKRSPRRCKKESHTENSSKEENTKGWILSFHPEPQHLESPEKSVQCKANGTINHSEYEVFENKDDKTIDVLEVFRVEKDMLLKLLRNLDIDEKGFEEASNSKARLTKSGSFPLFKSSQMRNMESSTTLNHKKNEVWAFPKGEKPLAAIKEQKKFASSFSKFTSHAKEMPLVTDHDADVDRGSKQNPGFKGWNQLVLHRFKAIKKKIKHALVEFKKNGSFVNSQDYIKSRNSDYESQKNEVSQMRRTSSINESLDRYTQLFEKSFRKDMKWHDSMSKSLTFTGEDSSESMSVNAPKLSRTRRNLSLPNLDPLGLFLLQEAIRDTSDKEIPARTSSVQNNTNPEIHDILVEQNPTLSEIHEGKESSTCRDVNLSAMNNYEREVTDENRDDTHQLALGDEKDVLAVLEANCENHATRPKKAGTETNHFFLFEPDIENNLNFNYVKNIIEFSGFMEENEGIQIWHTDTSDQPLNPSLFKKLEHFSHNEIESSGDEINNKVCDHQLLFNLVNEVLLQIYERSSSYFPRPFNFNLRLHPSPKGLHLLKQVWNSVELYLRLKPELDQTLDDVVARDLAHGGWMNLQWEEECVALEVEDMILEDLLNEAIFSMRI